MALTINFSYPLSETERKALLRLLDEKKEVEEKKEITVQKKQIGVREDAFGDKKTKFPKIHGKTRETILAIIRHLEGHATKQEILDQSNMSEASLQYYLWKLQKDGILMKSIEKPTRYFFKDEGDPTIGELLKNFDNKVRNR